MTRFPFSSYPNGWFAVGFAADFAVGQVVTRHVFGRDLVVYRTADGGLRAADAHCPHLGAHLGKGGVVEGERLRCPFHGWCFDGAGQCVEIPGAARIPPRAALGSWPVCERNGVAFVHHHAAGAPPAWEVPLLSDAEWTANRTILWKVRTHPQEVFENTVDAAHLRPVHHVERALLLGDPVGSTHSFHIALNLHADGAIVGMPGMMNDVILDVTLHGLGMGFVQTEVRNVGVHARQRIYCTPVDDEHIEIRGVVNVRHLGDAAATEQVAELFYQAYVIDFAMDFPIWENKIYRERPLLSGADGPFMVYRKWAQQFYRAID